MCEGLPRATSIGRADGATTPHRDLPFFYRIFNWIEIFSHEINKILFDKLVRTSLVQTVTGHIYDFNREKT